MKFRERNFFYELKRVAFLEKIFVKENEMYFSYILFFSHVGCWNVIGLISFLFLFHCFNTMNTPIFNEDLLAILFKKTISVSVLKTKNLSVLGLENAKIPKIQTIESKLNSTEWSFLMRNFRKFLNKNYKR